MSNKTNPGRYFEDFRLGEVIVHASPRTLSVGDAVLYTALYGGRFAVQGSDELAAAIGLERAPIDDFLVFHVVFGKTVPDISQNAVANLGYAECRFLAPVYPGDTLKAVSTVIGLKETSSRTTGVVYVRSVGLRGDGRKVLEFVRWVMVPKADPKRASPAEHVPQLATRVEPSALATGCPRLSLAAYDLELAGSRQLFEDYEVGEMIDHLDGVTIEEAEHQLATRLYQNPARVHFNQVAAAAGRFGRRLIYGGHIISLARALSFNGLSNAFAIAAINAGRHAAPMFAGDTLFACSQLTEKAQLPGRTDIGALRLRTLALKDRPCAELVRRGGPADNDPVVLDLDYWALIPRRHA